MASLRTLDPNLAPLAQKFVAWLEANGVNVTVTSTRRDAAQQLQLWERFKAGESKYPAAPPGHSMHDKGLAFDLHLDPPVYAAAGHAWESIGGTWGGRFADEIHFDVRDLV